MKYTAAFLFMLFIGSFVQAQKVPEYETVSLTILKIERVREDSEGALWYTNKLTMRDSRGIIYKASARCIQVTTPPTPDSPISCGHLAMPRIAETYAAKFVLGGTMIVFGELSPGTQGFEIESEEVSPQARAK